jgi:copper homeostasis protein
MRIIKEACIETIDQAEYAYLQGADTVEVCSRLDLDGLTPEIALIKSIEAKTTLGQHIMIRNRGGDFNYSEDDMEIMIQQIDEIKHYPVEGYVFGATKTFGGVTNLDFDLIEKIADQVYPKPLTVHKAIDTCTHILDVCKELIGRRENIRYLLTSGGCKTAMDGKETIKKMVEILSPTIIVKVAGKVNYNNWHFIHEHTGATHFHGRNIV